MFTSSHTREDFLAFHKILKNPNEMLHKIYRKCAQVHYQIDRVRCHIAVGLHAVGLHMVILVFIVLFVTWFLSKFLDK